MSEKTRRKKDGQRQDKENKEMREAQGDKEKKAAASQQKQEASNPSDAEPAAEGRRTS